MVTRQFLRPQQLEQEMTKLREASERKQKDREERARAADEHPKDEDDRMDRSYRFVLFGTWVVCCVFSKMFCC
jgi:hypothetical protein